MKIIKTLMEKKLELHHEFSLNRQYTRSIWQFYSVFNLAISILKIQEKPKLIEYRNRLWYKWMSYPGFSEKLWKEFKTLMQRDIQIILNALEFIEEESKDSIIGMGDHYKTGTIGMLAYQFPRD